MSLLRVTNLESASGARVAWTTTPINYDIGANDPFKGIELGLSSNEGRPCREITCNGAGVLNITGLDGVAVPLQFLAGQTIRIQAINLIAASSTATIVMVFW